MPDPEWEQLQAQMRSARTPEEKRAAADAMRRYLAKKGKGSKPTLVTLARGGGSSNAIPLSELPDAMEKDPQVYERVRKIVTRGK